MNLSDRINTKRLKRHFDELARVGAQAEGGITRLPLTEPERAAMDLVKKWMEEASLETRFDEFGNLFGHLEGDDPEKPVVMTGSHVDTVIQGGGFDGTVGTLSAIEALQVIRENGIPHSHPMEIGVFLSEEPVRFGAGTLGSKAFVGDFSREDLDRLKDKDGITLAEALRQWGFNPDALESVRRDPRTIKCFIELHIEQSVVLETKGIPIGVVDQIAAPTNLRLTVKGKAGHAGATPMALRRDSFMAAAEIALEVEKIANTISEDAVGTVGEVYVKPNAINVIPGEVIMGIDIRDVETGRKDEAYERLKAATDRIAKNRGVEAMLEVIIRQEPAKTERAIVNLIEKTCRDLGIPYTNITSGAYHDALNMAKVTDIGMIFVPSVKGVSHARDEFTPFEDIHRGARVLCEVLAELAK